MHMQTHMHTHGQTTGTSRFIRVVFFCSLFLLPFAVTLPFACHLPGLEDGFSVLPSGSSGLHGPTSGHSILSTRTVVYLADVALRLYGFGPKVLKGHCDCVDLYMLP